MKLLFRKTTLLLLAFCVAFSLQAQKLQQYIPKDASFVFSINLNNLNQKVSLDKLKEYDFYKEMMKEMNKEIKQNLSPTMADAFNNPSTYGMDFMSESFFFGDISEESSHFGFIFQLSDNQKFTKFFKENVAPEANGIAGTMGGWQTMTTDNAAIAWNKNIAVISGGTVNHNSHGGDQLDAIAHSKKEKSATAAYLQRIVKRKTGNSILTNLDFAKEAARKSDMKLWIDYGWISQLQMKDAAQGMGGMGDQMMEIFADFYKDTYYAIDMNFNEGEMVSDMRLYTNDKYIKMYRDMMSTGNLNKDYFKYIPKDNLMGHFAVAMDTEKFVGGMAEMFDPMMKEMQMSLADMETQALEGLKAMGIEMNRDGLYNLVKGDMMMAVTGLKEFEITTVQYDEDFNKVEEKTKQKLPVGVMMLSTGNESDLMKMLEMGVSFGGLTKETDKLFKLAVPSDEIPFDVYLAIKDGIVFLTNNEDLVMNKLKAGGYEKSMRMTKEDQSKLMTASARFFWDIPKTLSAVAEVAGEQGMMDKTATKMINVSKQSLESIVTNTDRKIIDSMTSQFQLNFVNKKMNALDQFFAYMNEMWLTAMNESGM